MLVVGSQGRTSSALERAEPPGIPTAVVGLAGREREERDRELADVVEAERPGSWCSPGG